MAVQLLFLSRAKNSLLSVHVQLRARQSFGEDLWWRGRVGNRRRGKIHVPRKLAKTRKTGAGRVPPWVLCLGSDFLYSPRNSLGRRECSSSPCCGGKMRHGKVKEANWSEGPIPGISDRFRRCLAHCLWHHRHERTLQGKYCY